VGVNAPYQNDAEYLEAELGWLDTVLRLAIERARSGRDRWAGLCISEEAVDKLIAPRDRAPAGAASSPPEEEAMAAAEAKRAEIAVRVNASLQAGVPLRLPRLGRLLALSPFEMDVLLVCLAPELDLKYEQLFAYLHDDATRKAPSIDLVLRLLCRGHEERAAARDSFLPGGRLARYGLVDVARGEPEPPLLARTLKLDQQTAERLLGRPRVDGWLGSSLRLVAPPAVAPTKAELEQGPLAAALAGYLETPRHDPWLAVLHGPDRLAREETVTKLCAAMGLPLLTVDLEALVESGLAFEISLRKAFQVAALESAAICVEPSDLLDAEGNAAAARRRALEAALLDMGWITFVSGASAWDPPDLLKRQWLFAQHFPVPGYAERHHLWESALSGRAGPDVDAAALAAGFRFTSANVLNAVAGARNNARLRGQGEDPLCCSDLEVACRAESSRGLARLARRVVNGYRWSDLVLPEDTKKQVQEIADFIRLREGIATEWGFGRKHTLGKGTNILFTGPSGTGKTMAAGIIASHLGLDLYKVDLSTVVSKYIGETEKNLNRLFVEAETANAVLFFDEADAIFGRRSEVKDAHDRYANIEVNYLLQKMEEQEGIVVLATNMSKNMDEAFVRRLQFTVVFPFPEEAERLRIWQQVFPDEAPVTSEVSFEFLSRRFKIAGGNIKNIALGAAFLARVDGGAIGMRQMVLAAKREFQKMGKICTRADFGEYYELVA
jgi:AAA+ superfamily predicted ATPase